MVLTRANKQDNALHKMTTTEYGVVLSGSSHSLRSRRFHLVKFSLPMAAFSHASTTQAFSRPQINHWGVTPLALAARSKSLRTDYEVRSIELPCLEVCRVQNNAGLDSAFSRADIRMHICTEYVWHSWVRIGGFSLQSDLRQLD